MLHIFFLFFALVLALVFFFFSGKILLSKFTDFNGSFFTRFFLSTIAGVIVFTFVSALFFTHFKSVFSLLIILLALAYFVSRKLNLNGTIVAEKLNLKQSPIPYLTPLIFVLLFLFFWFGRLVIDANFALMLPANPENSLYAQFAKIIAATGIESTFGIGFLPSDFPHNLSPYHYFDLWFTAGISHIFRISELETIHFFTLPLFNFLNVLGVCAVFEKFTALKFYHPFLALLFLFFTSCYFLPYGEEFVKYEFDFMEPVLGLYGEKLSFTFSAILVVILLFLEDKILMALLLVLLLPLLFPALLTSIYIGSPVFCFIVYRKKLISLKALKSLLIFQFIVLLSLYFFYRQAGALTPAFLTFTDYKGVNLTSIKMLVAEIFYRSWNKPFRSILMYLPYLLILFFTGRKSETNSGLRVFSILSLCIYAGALFSWATLYKMPEAWQIYTNVFVLFHVVLILFLFDSLFGENRRNTTIFAKLTLVLLLLTSGLFSFKGYINSQKIYTYSEPFLKKINSVLASENKKFVVAYLKNPAEYNTHMELFTGGLTGSYLQLQKQFYGMLNIGFFEFLNDSSGGSNFAKTFQNQNFYTFVEREKLENKFISLAQSQLNFLSLHQINYIAASHKAVIPDLIQQNAKAVFEDELTGEKFLILDNSATFKGGSKN